MKQFEAKGVLMDPTSSSGVGAKASLWSSSATKARRDPEERSDGADLPSRASGEVRSGPGESLLSMDMWTGAPCHDGITRFTLMVGFTLVDGVVLFVPDITQGLQLRDDARLRDNKVSEAPPLLSLGVARSGLRPSGLFIPQDQPEHNRWGRIRGCFGASDSTANRSAYIYEVQTSTIVSLILCICYR